MATVAFNQFINPWALDAINWWYYVVYCGWLIFELVFIYFFIVETKGTSFNNPNYLQYDWLGDCHTGRTLEETAALFDGDEQPQDLAVMGGEAAVMTQRMSRIHGISIRVETTAVEERKEEYYEMKKRHRESDTDCSTEQGTELKPRALWSLYTTPYVPERLIWFCDDSFVISTLIMNCKIWKDSVPYQL